MQLSRDIMLKLKIDILKKKSVSSQKRFEGPIVKIIVPSCWCDPEANPAKSPLRDVVSNPGFEDVYLFLFVSYHWLIGVSNYEIFSVCLFMKLINTILCLLRGISMVFSGSHQRHVIKFRVRVRKITPAKNLST